MYLYINHIVIYFYQLIYSAKKLHAYLVHELIKNGYFIKTELTRLIYKKSNRIQLKK